MNTQNALTLEPLVITDADVLDEMEQMMAEEALAHAHAACPPEELDWVEIGGLSSSKGDIRPCTLYTDEASADWLLEFLDTQEASMPLWQAFGHLASEAIASSTAPNTFVQMHFYATHCETVFVGGPTPHRCLLMLPREGEGLVPVYLHVVGLRLGDGAYHVLLGAVEGAVVDGEGEA